MMRGVVVLFGESFRLGFQGNRHIGSEESYAGQMEASKSHIDFVNQLRRDNRAEIDVVVNTYDTRYSEELKSLYEPLEFNLNSCHIGLHNIFRQSCDIASKFLDGRDFVFFLRIDLFLKEAFNSTFRAESDRIMWPSVCWVRDPWCFGMPRVSDTMVYVPSKWFHLVMNKDFVIDHTGWSQLLQHVGNDGQGAFLDTLHDSDSAKDWNPIYRISNRKEEKKWHSEGFLFTKDAKIINRVDGSVFRSAH